MKCLIVDDDLMSLSALKHFVERTDGLELAEACTNADDAGAALRKDDIDVIFLDVEMPGTTGLELLDSLSQTPQIILVSSEAKYAVDSYNYSVTDFLLKPVPYTRFLKAIDKIKHTMHRFVTPAEMFVKVDQKLVRLKLEDILYIEALADYIIIHTESRKYIVHSTMKGIEARLPLDRFVRVHRSYIVNMDRLDSIEDNSVLVHKKPLPIGGKFKDTLLTRINSL